MGIYNVIPMIKEYYTHDNCRKPFKVVIDFENTSALIYNNFTKSEIPIFSVLNYSNILIGTDPANKQYDGNSILIETSTMKYMYIGGFIYTFSTNENILEYSSPIHNNDQPYAFAIGTQNVYLLGESVYFPVNNVKDKEPYCSYYTHIFHDTKSYNKIVKTVLFGRTFG